MDTRELVKRAAIGAGAGLVGTLVLQGLRAGSQRVAPGTLPRMKKDPGPFMVRQAERALPLGARRRIPDEAEERAGQALGMGYGMWFGALYALVRPAGGARWAEGAMLGLACWAAGYLGWLPAIGVTEPVWREDVRATAGEAVRHALYGVGTVAAYDSALRLVGRR